MDRKQRYQKGIKATLISILINFFLVIIKFSAGFFGQSQAMIADAAHSFSDFISDFVVYFGFKIAKKPKDATHPYGHGKVETIVGLIIGFMLLAIGFEIFMQACGSFKTNIPRPSILALNAAILSIIFKEWLYQYNVNIGKLLKSPALIANAWHHRSDAYSSIAALVGITAARLGYPWMDPVAAIVVGIFVVKVALEILWETASELSEKSIDKKTIQKIKEIVKKVKGVKSMHKLRTRKFGAEIILDLHIQVQPNLTVEQGHLIATQVKNVIKKEITNVQSVLVHTEPFRKK
ncbi:MAG: cation diffusion facilitator family transporter [Candidatus Margulisbacteria bacterium]|nr:cation diffusion facilitator family transporter [Candidatus Margulisiibacteriota bacterium]